jgi:hypothetical protein
MSFVYWRSESEALVRPSQGQHGAIMNELRDRGVPREALWSGDFVYGWVLDLKEIRLFDLDAAQEATPHHTALSSSESELILAKAKAVAEAASSNHR